MASLLFSLYDLLGLAMFYDDYYFMTRIRGGCIKLRGCFEEDKKVYIFSRVLCQGFAFKSKRM
jgi:hypothetical protein